MTREVAEKLSLAEQQEGNVNNVASVASYVNEAGSTEVKATVTWSRVRYTGYNQLVVKVTPRSFATPSTLQVRALSGSGSAVDNFTLSR
jgi:hypothetical protein